MKTSRSRLAVSAIAFGAAAAASAAPLLLGPTAQAAVTKTAAGTKKAGVTVAGPVVDTRWGPVQVAVVVSNRKITDVKVPVYPHSKRRSAAINDRALPMLRSETLTAQSGSIDNVSGATVTWFGYRDSLQRAIDAAKAKGAF